LPSHNQVAHSYTANSKHVPKHQCQREAQDLQRQRKKVKIENIRT
jgi:hypothetical protein